MGHIERQYTDSEYEVARARLFGRIDKDRNLRDQLGSSAGMYMPKDLADTVFYNASFIRDDWPECDMTSMAANGSTWEKARLLGCDLVKSTMQYCEFSDCAFLDCQVRGSNFANSAFFASAFENATIDGCSFVGAAFESSLLTGGTVTDSTFELCRFENTVIEGIRFGNVNMCYASLDGAKLDRVELPFYQLPYTFFGLQRLAEFSDTTRVAVSHGDSMSAEEYFHYLPDFVVYLSHEHDYFPLVNCLEMLGEHDAAIELCLSGLECYRDERDYRMLYHLSLLATRVLGVGDDVRLEIADIVEGGSAGEGRMSRGEQFQFSKYFPRIKRALLDNPQGKVSLEISFQTDVPADDYGKLGSFMEAIEAAMAQADVQLAGKHLEVRHNSPFLVDVMMFGSPQDLIALANSFMSLSAPMTGEIIATAESAVEYVASNFGGSIVDGTGFVASTITIGAALAKAGAWIKRRLSPNIAVDDDMADEPRPYAESDAGRIERFEQRRRDFARLCDRVREIERLGARSMRDKGATRSPGHAAEAPRVDASRLDGIGIGIESVRVRVMDEV